MTPMRCKLLHLLVVLLAAATARAADRLPPEGPAPAAMKGPYEVTWDTPKGKSHHFPGAIRFSGDGKRLIVALDGETQVWNTATWKAAGKHIAHGHGVYDVSFDAAGKRMLVARDLVRQEDKGIKYVDAEWRVWDTETGEPVGPAVRHESVAAKLFHPSWSGSVFPARHAELSCDGQFAQVITAAGQVELWRTDTGKLDRTIKHETSIRSIRFLPDNTLVIVGWNSVAKVWDIKTGQLRATHEDFNNLLYCAGGRALEQVAVWGFSVREIETGKTLLIEEGYRKYSIGDMCISPSGNRVAVEADSRTEVWDVDAKKKLSTIFSYEPVALDPQGTVVIVTRSIGKDGQRASSLWDAETGKKIRDLGGSFIYATAFSPDGNTLAMLSPRSVSVIRADPAKKGAERWRVDKAVEEKR